MKREHRRMGGSSPRTSRGTSLNRMPLTASEKRKKQVTGLHGVEDGKSTEEREEGAKVGVMPRAC